MLKQIRTIPNPFTNAYGIARTLLALGTAGTLAFSDSATLFRPVATLGEYPLCQGITTTGAFCLVPRGQFDTLRWLCVAVLLLTATGWRPRITALPHAYISFSIFSGIAIGDGGDQITWILTLLIAAVGLGDGRTWHWERAPHMDPRPLTALVATSALVIARLQMSFVYFQASVAKLPHPEWADGTAMYYWANNASFGAPGWLRPAVNWVLDNSWGVAALTWTPLVLELALAASLLLPQKARWILLPLGVFFHLCIAVIMGLWSFALAMWGGLFLLLTPLGHVIDLPAIRRSRGRGPDDGHGQVFDGASEEVPVSPSPERASV